MSIPTRCRVGDVFSTASRRTTTSPKPLTDKPGACSKPVTTGLIVFVGRYLESGSISHYIPPPPPPPPVMCHSFHTLKRNTPKATDRSLEGPFVISRRALAREGDYEMMSVVYVRACVRCVR